MCMYDNIICMYVVLIGDYDTGMHGMVCCIVRVCTVYTLEFSS